MMLHFVGVAVNRGRIHVCCLGLVTTILSLRANICDVSLSLYSLE